MGYTEHEENSNEASRTFLRSTLNFTGWLKCHTTAEEMHCRLKLRFKLDS